VVAEGRGTVVVWVVAAVVGVVALMRLTGSDDDPATGDTVRVERAPSAATGAGPANRGQGGVFVHVAGAVRRPGLVRVPAGARVAAAVARAGGPSRKSDLTGVNLAARVEDGQQVVVPAAGVVAAGAVAAAGGPSGAATAPGVKPSIGTATIEQLDEIDGIGPTLAERIVEYRTENGGFSSLDELQDVEGIGEKRLETLREALQP
jgi:competence protein ComEA